jgi:hypothetical protein
VDTIRTVQEGSQFTIALCLEDANLAPVSGKLTSFTLGVTYPAEISAPDVVDDGTRDLNANPNLNEGSALGGTNWDCNALDIPLSAPNGTPSPATLTCNTTNYQANTLGPPPVHLATISFNTVSTGTAALAYTDFTQDPVTSLLPTVAELLCGIDIQCLGATITIAGPTPTFTRTPTPTATLTPSVTPTPTRTPLPATPTPTDTPTQIPTRVPGACDGDVNLDGVVDGRDLAYVGRSLHSVAGDSRYNVQADIDMDGAVTARDLAVVIRDHLSPECF